MLSNRQLEERWNSEDGKERLSKVLDAMRGRDPWWDILSGFPGVDEVENGRDLRGAGLGRVELSDVDLSDVDFRGANLCSATLIHTLLDNSKFGDANLNRATFSEASFDGTDFTGANLSGARLVEADLSNCDLLMTNLSDAILSRAKVSSGGQDLMEVNLSGADLTDADVMDTNLTKANLSNADLSRADLSGGTLEDANLSGAKVSGTRFYDVNDFTLEEKQDLKARGASLSEVDELEALRDLHLNSGLPPGNQDALSVQEIIDGEESEIVEFKSTLRKNLHTEKNDEKMKLECLKTIAAFLNSKGGTLLVGVANNGEILGIESDGFANEDKMSLHLVSIVNDRLGPESMTRIALRFEAVAGAKVLRVGCGRSDTPVYHRDRKTEQFFIRTGPATTELVVSEAITYITKHFSEGTGSTGS